MAIRAALFTGLALAIAAPIAAETNATAPSQNAGYATYERVGEVLINAMICEGFGYTVDNDGLTQWTMQQVDTLADQNEGYDRADAARRVTRAATSRYWFVRDRYDSAFSLGSQGAYYSPQRFTMKYTKACADLEQSGDVGAYFERTSEAPRTIRLMNRMRNALQRNEVAQHFSRAYPPYLGDDIGEPS